MSRRRKPAMNMIEGSLGDKVLQFAVPLAITGVLQQIFNATDVAVVGQFAGKNAMAAVGSNSPVVGLMVNLFVGVSLGANVVISRFTGQRNPDGIRRSVHTAVLVALITGVIVAVLGILISRPMLELLGVPASIMPMALAYLRIYLLGMPVILLYNFESSIFRSQGDTRTPLLCLITAGLLNVALNLFFVLVLHMDADGVAAATVISNTVSSGLMFLVLCRTGAPIRIRFRDFRIDRGILKVMLQIGLPAGLQGMVFSISNLCIQSALNSLGPDIIAASSAAFNIEIVAYYIINAFGQAETTFIGQNSGARKPDRCKRVIRIGLAQDLIFTAILCAAIIYFAVPLLKLFNTDPEVVRYGQIRIVYILSFEVINALIEGFSGVLRGFGKSLAPALVALVGICGTRIVWVFFVFPNHPDFRLLILCFPISWAITAGILILYYLLIRRRLFADIAPAGVH